METTTTTQSIMRKIESTSNKEVSTATFKDYNITFNVEREQGQVKMIRFNGFRPTGESFSGSLQAGGLTNISFAPIVATDVDIALAIGAEISSIQAMDKEI